MSYNSLRGIVEHPHIILCCFDLVDTGKDTLLSSLLLTIS